MSLKLPPDWLDSKTCSGMLKVGGGHTLSWRWFGPDDAMTVVVLHGGPGSGSTTEHLRFFNPERHRVVLLDQRGSGQSIPSASTSMNTTQDLLNDLEVLRQHLNVESWLVFGVSWGACLALLYAQVYPRSCKRLVLSGLSNRHDHQTAWILERRPELLPERHETFLAALSSEDRIDPVAAYYRKSLSVNRRDQLEATFAVWALEDGLEESTPSALRQMPLNDISENMVSRAKIYLHYWANRTFLPDGQLLISPAALNNIPITLIHGASDWICPLSGAQKIADALARVTFIVVPGAGHSPYGPEMSSALREAVAPD